MPGNVGAMSRSPVLSGTILATRNVAVRVTSLTRPRTGSTPSSRSHRASRSDPSRPNRSARSRSDRSESFEPFESFNAVTSEYGISRSPTRSVFARYVNIGCARRPAPFERLRHRCGSRRRPAGRHRRRSTARARRSSPPWCSGRRPRAARWLRTACSIAAVASESGSCPETSSVLTRPSTDRSCCSRESGTNTARTSPCCGSSANSPSRFDGMTRRTVSRSVRPDLVPAAVQRLERDIRRTLHPHQDHAVCGSARSAAPAPGSHTRRDWTDR